MGLTIKVLCHSHHSIGIYGRSINYKDESVGGGGAVTSHLFLSIRLIENEGSPPASSIIISIFD